LPDYSQLQNYEPPVTTRIHAADGALLGESAKERRLYLPIQAVPKLVINAFLAAEDKNFYDHGGIDSNRRPQGASTITQQVAKNFLLTNEVSFSRKIKEALLAMRIERAYSKDRILELYLNKSISALAPMASLLLRSPIGARLQKRPIWRRCRRCRECCIRCATMTARSSAATMSLIACWGRLDQAGRCRQGAQGAANRRWP
jgi:hypothetical protein